MRRTSVALVVAVALVSVSPGCSLVLVRDAPVAEPAPARWPGCTEHRIWPAADTAIAAVAIVGVFVLARSDDSLDRLGAAFEGALAAGFGYSAWHGFSETARCQRARDAYERAALDETGAAAMPERDPEAVSARPSRGRTP